MSDVPQYEHGLMHGQHTKRFYWILGAVCLGGGMLGGYFIAPEEWSIVRRLLAGAFTGLWSGFCVFAWHLLFYGTVEERDTRMSERGEDV